MYTSFDIIKIKELMIAMKRLADEQDKRKTSTGFTDIEMNHRAADKILCDILEEIGFNEVVEDFERINKWYA